MTAGGLVELRTFGIREAFRLRALAHAWRVTRPDGSVERHVVALWLVVLAARVLDVAARVLAHELTHHVYWARQDAGTMNPYEDHHHPPAHGCVMLAKDGWKHATWLHSEVLPGEVRTFIRARALEVHG